MILVIRGEGKLARNACHRPSSGSAAYRWPVISQVVDPFDAYPLNLEGILIHRSETGGINLRSSHSPLAQFLARARLFHGQSAKAKSR